MKLSRFFVATLITICFSVTSSAAILTFDLTYSGAGNGNGALGVGFISFDDTQFPNTTVDFFDVPAATLGIVDFSITISGAIAGNGTFDQTDINSGWVLALGGPLDLNSELVGQTNFFDFNWLCGLNSLPCANPLAPEGFGPFVITTAGGDLLDLVSASPRPVPVPAALWLLGSAIAGLGAMRRAKES